MENKRTVRTVIYWDRVFIAASILVLAIVAVANFALFSAAEAQTAEAAGTKESAAAITGAQSPDTAQTGVVDKEDSALGLTVVVDPGHGGDSIGATDWSGTRLEQDDTLRLGLKLRDALEELGVTVIMTRDTDVDVTLDERCAVANENDADLFVSIHRNSSEDHAYGAEVWVDNDMPEEDTLLAQNILDALVSVGVSDDRGVQYGYRGDQTVDYQVNRETNMPSCLVEVGFMTNDTDNELFDENIDAYAEQMAEAILKSGVELGLVDSSTDSE